MKWSRLTLKSKLLVTHLAVIAAGVATYLLAVAALSSGGPPTMALTIPALVALAVSSTVAIVLSRRLAEEVATTARNVAAAARRLAKGHYTDRVKIEGSSHTSRDDDLGRLAPAFDDLAKSLETAERRRIELFGEVAHDLRTPVAILEGYLEGLLDGFVKPSPETWAMLHDEASRVHRLVDELQDLAHAEARPQPPDLQPVDPGLIARTALDRLQLHFDEKGLEVVTNIPEVLPPVRADFDHAIRVLVNLLTNALQYTPAPGRVTLSVSIGPQSGEVLFQVADTGVGIAAEHVPHLFERFFRVERSRGRSSGGSGIGLPVAKALVEGMGGRIWAESQGAGKGSTFSFTLPTA